MKKYIILIILLNTAFLFPAKHPKNIIIMIGDGMGVAQVSTSVLANPNSAFRLFKNTGFSITYSANKLITESAAGATALATGFKTKNRSISVDTNDKPLTTLFEVAKKKNMKSGVVVLCSVVDATPAAFTAHSPDRKNKYDIAHQILTSDCDVVIGGGQKYFRVDTSKDAFDADAFKSSLVKSGYSFYPTFDKLTHATGKKYFALLENEDLPKATERKYSLKDLVKKAIESLNESKTGFVLMIEGSQIDFAGHENNSQYMIDEVKDFAEAVGFVYDFASKDKETLVVVTADHETGGTGITKGNTDGSNMELSFLLKGHTASMVPVFSFGPESDKFTGIQQNSDIGKKLMNCVKSK